MDINENITDALKAHHGLIETRSEEGKVVVMTMDVYRELLGIGNEEELQESIHAIQTAMKEVEEGKTNSVDEVFASLEQKYGVKD